MASAEQTRGFRSHRWLVRALTLLLPLVVLGQVLLGAAPPAGATPADAAPADAAPAQRIAATAPAPERYRCDGDLLLATRYGGAVDAPAIPNRLGETLPGAFVVLQWRGRTLQLPRTNDADSLRYSDGRWLWNPQDPERPIFRERRGILRTYLCQRDP